MAEMATKTDAESDNHPVRQRSNSDPKPAVEPLRVTSDNIDGSSGDSNKFLISGSSTTPRPVKHHKDEHRRNGETKPAANDSGHAATPPAERKSKLATLGKIFRPWKWKRKKKSEKIEKAAVEIERKISMRTSREELIRKGVIKEPEDNQNHLPKIGETLKESEEERLEETEVSKSDGVSNSASTASAVPVPATRGVPEYPAMGNTTPVVTHPASQSSSHLPESTASVPESPSVSASATPHVDFSSAYPPSPVVPVSSSTHARPIIVPGSCPSPSLHTYRDGVPSPALQHPPPPKYTEAVAQVVSPEMRNFAFQPGGDAHKRVAVVAPQEIHSDREEYGNDEDEDANNAELNKYITDPDLVLPHSPYEAVLASEPDLTKRPQKSALKKSCPTPTSSWSARPLDTRQASPSPTPGIGGPHFAPPRHFEGQPNRLSPQPSSTAPVVSVKPIPRPRVSIQASGDNESDKENLPSAGDSEAQQNDRQLTDSDSEDEEIKYRDDYDENSLAAKVARNDSLARFLSNRPTENDLVAKNIIPTQSESEKKVLREAIGSKLTRRLSLRPTQEELENRNILHQQTSDEHLAEKERKRRYLVRKLSFRPSIEELRERKIIDFSDYVEVTDAHEYDRRAEKPWTKLTPRDKAAIRKELNEFKSKEMDVHEDSRHLTRFHKP